MIIAIPETKIEKLTKIINRYNKKGANILFEIGEKVVEDGNLYVSDPATHITTRYDIKVNCVLVNVEGKYRIEDWAFVGTIEFTDNGNIIRLADSSFDGKVPEKYLHTPKICEHCGKVRNRKDTYLIHNEKLNEFKQVGSTCLLDYTKGLDAGMCASIMSCLDKIIDLGNLDFDEEGFFGGGFNPTGCGAANNIKNYAIALVNAFGYQRMSGCEGSASDLADWYFGRGNGYKSNPKDFSSLKPATDEEVEVLNEYAKEHIDDDFGYMRNASLAWLKDGIEYRDFGLICSFVFTYNKEMKKLELQKAKMADKNNEWVGNIGDRITIKVASIRLLYQSSVEVAWHTYANSWTYEIIDTEGHTLIWKSSNDITTEFKQVKIGEYENFDHERYNDYNSDWDIDVIYTYKPLTIVGTIKDHSEYKGVKQTVITRGKVTEKETIKTESRYDKR